MSLLATISASAALLVLNPANPAAGDAGYQDEGDERFASRSIGTGSFPALPSTVKPSLVMPFTYVTSSVAVGTQPPLPTTVKPSVVMPFTYLFPSAGGGMSPVRLVSWDGDFELMKTSRRMRIWRSHIAYRLTVDAEGNATHCELTETFRLRRVTDTLCDVLMEHHTFEPAHDESGAAVESSYTSRISYQEMRERL